MSNLTRRGEVVTAQEVLRLAVAQGEWVRGAHVDAETFPHAARTYLGDGTGLAWSLPSELRRQGRFAVDAELVVAVRPALARRYGLDDPLAFAEAWTRAEVWAKLFDVPIITWLSRHGLDVPQDVRQAVGSGALAWQTRAEHDVVVACGVLLTR